MQEVTLEEQAKMAILLDDKIKGIIRNVVREALEDPTFVSSIMAYELTTHLAPYMYHSASTFSAFREAVKSVIKDQMKKY